MAHCGTLTRVRGGPFFSVDNVMVSGWPDPRTMKEALADLRAKHQEHADLDMARMIQQLEAEIEIRERRPKPGS